MEQLAINFDICERKHGGDGESSEAHASIIGAKQRQWSRILDYVRSRGMDGATLEEIAIGLEMRMQSASARRSELLASGQLKKTDRVRKTTSGRAARVVVDPRFARAADQAGAPAEAPLVESLSVQPLGA